MVIGRVLGVISLQSTLQNAEKLRWLQVRTEDSTTVALDLAGAKAQDLVLLCEGEAAHLAAAECPVDAAIVGVVSNTGNCG